MRNFRDRHRNPGGPLAARRAAGGLTEITFPTAVTLTGSAGAGSWITTPDANDLDLTGDFWLAAKIAPTDWTPASGQIIVAKEQTTSTRSFRFYLTGAGGTLSLAWSTNGTTVSTQTSTVAAGGTDGAPLWVAVEMDVDNGAGAYGVKFYTAPTGDRFPTSWTQLGTTKTGGATTSVFSSTSQIEIGSRVNSAAEWLAGDVYGTVIGSGLLAAATRVALFTAFGVSGATYTDPYGHVWTVN